jgi:hypothetical protein
MTARASIPLTGLTILAALLCGLSWRLAHGQPLTLQAFIDKGKQAVLLSRRHGLDAAERIFADPRNGYLDLDGPGLHAWATDARGVILFDLSGQTVPGTDLSKWTNSEGMALMDEIWQQARGEAGGLLARYPGMPHPRSNQIQAADFWCGRMPDRATVCLTFWPDAH